MLLDAVWEDINLRAPAALVRSILRAIQQNNSIRSVSLTRLRPTNISTFLDNASSITSFRLFECVGEQGASDLAGALQRNTNIETLGLSRLADLYAVPILEGLGINTSVKTLIFSPTSSSTNISDATSHALQQLLESTTSIQRFELHNNATFCERLFRPIAQTITNSECVSELKFWWVEFQDQSSIAQLQSILQNKRNLTALCLHYCSFGGGQVHGDIISMISRPDSLLRCFEFQSLDSLEEHFQRIQFKNLLRVIEKSKLERFRIGYIQTPQQLQTLIESIPLMKLKELEVHFRDDEDEVDGEYDQETIRQDLLHAVATNFTLLSVKCNRFENNDKQTLAFYAKRNTCLDQWVNTPETIDDQKVWPEALGLAQRAGPDALFQGLRSVLESDEYVSLKGGRKRKRPEYYTPSL